MLVNCCVLSAGSVQECLHCWVQCTCPASQGWRFGAVGTTFEMQLDTGQIVCCSQGQEDHLVGDVTDLTATWHHFVDRPSPAAHFQFFLSTSATCGSLKCENRYACATNSFLARPRHALGSNAAPALANGAATRY